MDYTGLTIKELKEELKNKNLHISGKKSVLVERLEKYDLENKKNPNTITCHVKTLFGQYYKIDLSKDANGLDLKNAIKEKNNIPVERMVIWHMRNGEPRFGDKMYPDGRIGYKIDDSSLQEQNIVEESFFDLLISFRKR